ncbi:MAG: PLP-dependent aminotransferase family protein, partial [Cohaesibacteraceae bacterium]|nr:PLP-dependent aminotransferase family protein [Cohaesibacteraceae bacterium]
GIRLPSCRKVAGHLGISRNTVISAYQNLIVDGLVISRAKSGYFVDDNSRKSSFGQLAAADNSASKPAPGLFEKISPTHYPSRYRNTERPYNWLEYKYPFVCNQMDAGRFPLTDWRRCSNEALGRAHAPHIFSDHLYEDCEELLTQVRTRLLPRRGIVAEPDQILLTAGAQQAIYITSVLLGGPTRTIGAENPCYQDARNIFDQQFGNVRPIPVDLEGIVVSRELADCDLVYTTPNHQFPTTVRMSKQRRTQLLSFARENNVVIIEDDYDSETDFDPLIVPALCSAPDGASIVYVGSLSKSLSPGLRIGYLVGPADFIREARALRGMMIRHLPPLIQLTAAHYIRLGHYDALVSRFQSAFENRWHVARAALAKSFPDADITSGWGGTNFFITAPIGVDLTGLTTAARMQGVVIDPTRACYRNPDDGRDKLRLGVSAIKAEKITEGIAVVRSIYDRIVSGN